MSGLWSFFAELIAPNTSTTKLRAHDKLAVPQRPMNEKPAAPAPLFAPGTQIRYDTSLVTRLKADHQALVNLFNQMFSHAQEGQYDVLKQNIDDFRHLFNAHLLTENTKLYIYLDKALKSDDANYEIIQEFRREMNQIGKVVRQFLIKWGETPFDEIQSALFLKEAGGIGSVLVKRIETEETRLYEIYQMMPDLMHD